MAGKDVIETYDEIPRVERGGKYDWETIFDSKPNMLVKGKNFDCRSTSFATNARSAAERLGVKLEELSVRKDTVYIKSKEKFVR